MTGSGDKGSSRLLDYTFCMVSIVKTTVDRIAAVNIRRGWETALHWKGYGRQPDAAMLNDLRALGETMGAFRSGQMLRYEVFKKWGTDSDKKRLEDMMHDDTLLDGNHIWLMQSIYCDIHEQVASTHYS